MYNTYRRKYTTVDSEYIVQRIQYKLQYLKPLSYLTPFLFIIVDQITQKNISTVESPQSYPLHCISNHLRTIAKRSYNWIEAIQLSVYPESGFWSTATGKVQ